MSAVVTNARNRIAYNVVRSLGRRHIDVHTADFGERPMAAYSRYSRSHFTYPSPYTAQAEFVQCLAEQVRRLEAKVLIPVYEETFLIAKHADLFAPFVAMVLPTYEQILTAHNKDAWAGIARRLGIPVPEDYDVASVIDGRIPLGDLRYPVLVKPKQGGGGWGIARAESATALGAMLRRPDRDGLAWNRFFIQEEIPGRTHCVAMLMRRGQYRAKVTYRQLREYPVSAGQATLRVSLSDPQAEQCLQRLLEHLGWDGVCQADFVVDARSGAPYLVDLNPRLWGSLVQAIASGVDFPYLIYRMAREGDVEPVAGFATGVTTRWLGGEIRAFFPHLRQSRRKLEFLRSFFLPTHGARMFDDFSGADPLPFLAWSMQTLRKAAGSRLGRAQGRESLEGIWE